MILRCVSSFEATDGSRPLRLMIPSAGARSLVALAASLATSTPRLGFRLLRPIPVRTLTARADDWLCILLAWRPYVRAPFTAESLQSNARHRWLFYHKHMRNAI